LLGEGQHPGKGGEGTRGKVYRRNHDPICEEKAHKGTANCAKKRERVTGPIFVDR